MKEVTLGLTRRPFTLRQAIERFGDKFVPCRRFLVVQKGKVRPVDDFIEFGHNATSSNAEAVDMGGRCGSWPCQSMGARSQT